MNLTKDVGQRFPEELEKNSTKNTINKSHLLQGRVDLFSCLTTKHFKVLIITPCHSGKKYNEHLD